MLKAPRLVEHAELADLNTDAVLLDDPERGAVLARGSDEDCIGLGRPWDEWLRSLELSADNSGLHALWIPLRPFLPNRHGEQCLARGHLWKPVCPQRIVRGLEKGNGRHGVAEKRPRRRRVTKLLGGEREVEKLEAGAAERRRDHQARDPEPDEIPPERGIVPRAAFHDRAHARRRTPLGEKPSERALEEELVFREPEVHPRPPSSL